MTHNTNLPAPSEAPTVPAALHAALEALFDTLLEGVGGKLTLLAKLDEKPASQAWLVEADNCARDWFYAPHSLAEAAREALATLEETGPDDAAQVRSVFGTPDAAFDNAEVLLEVTTPTTDGAPPTAVMVGNLAQGWVLGASAAPGDYSDVDADATGTFWLVVGTPEQAEAAVIREVKAIANTSVATLMDTINALPARYRDNALRQAAAPLLSALSASPAGTL